MMNVESRRVPGAAVVPGSAVTRASAVARASAVVPGSERSAVVPGSAVARASAVVPGSERSAVVSGAAVTRASAVVRASAIVPGSAVVPVATLGLAAGCWAVAAWLMHGMDMGVATRPGSVGFFAAAWVTMMAAMMLPGATPAVTAYARGIGTPLAAARFAGSYLAIWALAGVAAYALDLPHGSLAAGLVVMAAGAYELTSAKRNLRRRCREDAGSGLWFGLCCIGSSAGLMAMLVALGVMSLFWMSMVAVIVTAQKLLPARAAIDVPVALAIIGLGFVILFTPSLVPGLMPPAM